MGNLIKKQRFVKVASKRTQKVLDAIDVLSNCSNRTNYEFTQEDVQKMLKAIKEKVKYLELSFTQSVQKNKNIFKF